MSDHHLILSGILRDLLKRTESPTVIRRISNLVKEGMLYWAEIDAATSFEWAREDVSNYTPSDADAMFGELRNIWPDEMLSWIEDNTTIRDHAEDNHDLRWN